MTLQPYPLLLAPSYKDYLWGGERILRLFNRSESITPCAESWEASDRKEGPSVILNGPLKNYKLFEALQKHPSFLGSFSSFPLLIKLIDAQKSLSIQVHPCEKKAHHLKGEPKNEAWHILEAEPNSFIYLGLKEKLSLKEIEEAIKSQTLETYLHRIEVKPKQTFFIPAGVIHSIGSGCLIYEIQQNSNTTYRLYDWNRKDAKGNQRKLHIDQGLKALLEDQGPFCALEEKSIETQSGEKKQLIQSKYFELFRFCFSKAYFIQPSEKGRHFFMTEGSCLLEYENEAIILQKGQSLLAPSKCRAFHLTALEKSCELLEAHF